MSLVASSATDRGRTRVRSAFIIDDEAGVRQVIALTLDDLGIASESFMAVRPAVAALIERPPALVFLDVVLCDSHAVDLIERLSGTSFRGMIQLMSGGCQTLTETIYRMGTQRGLTLLPPIQKPFGRGAIRVAAASAGFRATAGAA